jgi:hypothetical protein
MVSICKDCWQEFLSSSEYKRHQQSHLQTHLDKWSSNTKPVKVSWKPLEGMTQDLLKIFEKYRLGERAMLCLWYNGQLNTAIRERPRILELQDRLLQEML